MAMAVVFETAHFRGKSKPGHPGQALKEHKLLFPDYRPRRMRRSDAFRRMIRETNLSPDDLILPVFAIKGKNKIR